MLSLKLKVPHALLLRVDEVIQGRPDSMKHDQHPKLRVAKRIVVAVIGGTVTLIGIALIVLPGPAFVIIPIGLSILATQFLWARRFLRKARQMATRLTSHPPRDA